MSSAAQFELLTDLAYLVAKHGPKTFSELAEILDEPTGVETLVQILKASAKVSQQRPERKRALPKKPPNDEMSRILSELQTQPSEKRQQLLEFMQSLGTKQILPSLRSLKDFAADNGLRPVTASSREKALRPLLKDLASRSTDELSRLLSRAPNEKFKNDRTLDGWTGVILKQRHGDR